MAEIKEEARFSMIADNEINISDKSLSINYNNSELLIETKKEQILKEDTKIKINTTLDNIMDEDKSSNYNDKESLDVFGNGKLVKFTLVKSETMKQPMTRDLVTIDFIGKLSNGDIVEEHKGYKFHIGDMEVCNGLDIVIRHMNIDEVAEVFVDSYYAYGSLGLPNTTQPEKSIQPYSKITYEVKLLSIERETPEDLKSFDLRCKYATQKKERANFWYNRSEFYKAIHLYKRALEYVFYDNAEDKEKDPQFSMSEMKTFLKHCLVLHNNLAIAHIKIFAFDAALNSLNYILCLQPNNTKALYRKGTILQGKGDIEGALSSYKKAATLEPSNKEIKLALSKLRQWERSEMNKEREFCKKMLGLINEKGKKIKKAQNVKLKLIGCITIPILLGAAGAAFYYYKH